MPIATRPRLALICSLFLTLCSPAAHARPEVDLAAPAQICASSPALTLAEAAGTPFRTERFLYLSGGAGLGWSGILQKLRATFDARGLPQFGAAPVWDAGAALTGAGAAQAAADPMSRNIFTGQAASGTIVRTVPWHWNLLDAGQKAFLNIGPDGVSVDGLGQARLNFLRGMRALEGSGPGAVLRARRSVLGDLLATEPLRVGPPSSTVRGDGYREFFDEYRNRAATVYALAGDGMLHAFDDAGGAELFAYVPNAVHPALSLLTAPGAWRGGAQPGAAGVGEALVSGRWRTVLAAGMGGAAQGVFALDVSDPARFGSGDGALFEFTDRDDPDIGNVTAAPAVARFRTRTVKGIPEYRYFVVVSSGFNNYRSDGFGRFNPDAPGVLFLLSLDKSRSARWQLNVNYYKFSVPASDPGLPNALGPAALVTANDGAVRYAYAGDLQGNLWRFDFTGAAPWRNAVAAGAPLFTATDAGGARQPVSARPRAAFAPGGGYILLFGTGKYLEEQDALPANFRTQSFYAIRDTAAAGYRVARADLAERGVSRTAGASDAVEVRGPDFRYGTGPGERKGWYLDFPSSAATGERSIADAGLSGQQVSFLTLLPGTARCDGGGRAYVLNALTGLTDGEGLNGLAFATGAASRALLLESRALAPPQGTGRQAAIRRRIFMVDPAAASGGAAATLLREWSADRELASRRIGWRELPNWRELLAPSAAN